MQVLERKEQLSAIEARPLLVEPLFALQMMEELPSVDEPTFGVSKTPSDDAWRHYIRKYEVQFLLRLEAELERNNERVVHASEDQPLSQRVCDLSSLYDVLLADGLERIDTGSIAFPDLHDLAEAALADDGDELKVVDSERLTLENKSILASRRSQRCHAQCSA